MSWRRRTWARQPTKPVRPWPAAQWTISSVCSRARGRRIWLIRRVGRLVAKDLFAGKPPTGLWPTRLLMFAFVLRSDRRRLTRVGRLSRGVVEWGDRHGCRSSAVAPGMARRRVPTPRHRSEGTRRSRAGRQRKWFRPFAVTKGRNRQGETSISRTANAVGATRFDTRRRRTMTRCIWATEASGSRQASLQRTGARLQARMGRWPVLKDV